jgi:hypothetical protein
MAAVMRANRCDGDARFRPQAPEAPPTPSAAASLGTGAARTPFINMRQDKPHSTLQTPRRTARAGLSLKALVAAAAAIGVAIGLALPTPHKPHAPTHSQFVTLELGPG